MTNEAFWILYFYIKSGIEVIFDAGFKNVKLDLFRATRHAKVKFSY